jgi:hypothetical protein
VLKMLCLRLGDEYERSVQIGVIVEEAVTVRWRNTTFEVMLHKRKYKMEHTKTREYFKLGHRHRQRHRICEYFITI